MKIKFLSIVFVISLFATNLNAQSVAGDTAPLAALGLQMTPKIEAVIRGLYPDG